MDTEKPTAPPCTHPPSHPHSSFQATATLSTPVDYSRPLDPSTSTNSQQPTRDEKGKDKQATENEDEGQGDIKAEKTPQPQLQSRKGDDEEEEEEEKEEDGEDGDDDEDKEDEYTELFQVLANAASMKAFDEQMNNEGGALSDGLGKAAWYHGVRYMGMGEFGESIAGSGASDDGGSFREGESEGESEGHGDRRREEGEEEGQEKGDREERRLGEEEEKEGKEEEGPEREYDDEDDYVIITALGEQTDSDDESWCFVEDSEEEEDNDDDEGSKDIENNEDKEGNVDRSERDDTNINSRKGNTKNDHISDNDEWHDHHHYHHCQLFRSIATQATTTTNPQQRQPHPQLQEQGQIPVINTPFETLQSSPTSFTIQLAIPGAKWWDISVAYDPNTNVLAISGVLYRIVLPVEDLSSASFYFSFHFSPSSSSLESESETDDRGRLNAGGLDQGSHRELSPDFESDLELWLAYESTSRPGVDSASGSVQLGGYGEGGKQGGGDDDDDGDSSTDTDSNNKQSQTRTQIPTTTERILPIRKILGQVNSVICSPTPTPVCRPSPSSTPEEQKQHRGGNHEQIKTRLEDGILTVVVPLVVEGEADNESMVGMAM